MDYFLTYKVSQDHLELIFTQIRRIGGWNNNPNCLEMNSAVRKISTHVHGLVSKKANFFAQDNTKNLHTVNPKLESCLDIFLLKQRKNFFSRGEKFFSCLVQYVCLQKTEVSVAHVCLVYFGTYKPFNINFLVYL